jgi:hypothetical protein
VTAEPSIFILSSFVFCEGKEKEEEEEKLGHRVVLVLQFFHFIFPSPPPATHIPPIDRLSLSLFLSFCQNSG